MRILWTVNVVPTDFSSILGLKHEFFGGWVESMITQLKGKDNLELAVACKMQGEKSETTTISNITYFSLAYGSETSISEQCDQLLDTFRPDIVQIEGTEFPHALAMMEAANRKKIPSVISLQGILNGQYQYQCGELLMDDLMLSSSLTYLLAGWLLHFRKTRWFKARLKSERDIIAQAQFLLGRTSWDRAHSYAINKNAKYFHCNRILRTPFYNTQWRLDKIERHSIYVGNGYSALKGLHFVIQALPQLIHDFPDVKVYVAGNPPYTDNDTRLFFKQGYAAYLKKLVKDLKVENHIYFTGPLQARQVADKLSRVNAYVLCSTIENSPNTLGEAMLVGTPCVAAYVGGVADMASDGQDALFYRANDPILLAWNIKRIFDDDDLATCLSQNAQRHASATHDPKANANALLDAYTQVLK